MLTDLRPLFPYMRRYWKKYLAGTIAVFGNNGIWILFPLVIGRAVNDLNSGVTHQKLVYYSLELVAIAAGKGVFQFLTRWIMIGISREIEFDIRNDFFRHLESLSYSFYQRTRTGDIMARATNDLNAVRMLLGPAIMYSLNTVVFTAGALFFMLRISPKLTMWAFLPLPIASILVQYFGTKIHERFERIQAMFSDISARTQENFSGARVIRAYAQEEAEIEKFESDSQEYMDRSMPLARLMGMLWPTLEAMLGIAIVIILWVGGHEVLARRIDVGKFVAFNTYMVMLTWPIIALGWVINIFQRGSASMQRIAEVLHTTPEIVDDPEQITAEPGTEIFGEIEFRNLTFAYPRESKLRDSSAAPTIVPGTPILKNINLKIPAGTSLAIVGPTGSGKSTFVNLIPRIYDAEPGMVLIDGRPIREFPLAMLRANIGFVPQETFLFSATIRENIAFGVLSASDEQVRRAAEVARIATDIESFPEKYQTMVGERGLTLSGGQKQRTAIARAVIRDPRILVLDDALASVDTQTEEYILEHLRRVMQGRTTIFISHRVSTVRNADRIAVLHHGEIVEYGTHEELLALNGYYTELHNRQLLEEELETV
ncbi:MAG TPA: ABC transporter ATP-binding protein [candidate division Zixibacteria bacterium]|nr:ABC transporter ATP-binding protein [candidate division Zixibacteria bacterium]